MNTILIASQKVRQFDGLYSLNDLHKASGAADSHRPSKFVRNQQTKDLIKEIELSPDLGLALKTLKGGSSPGTYACKYLVYAYAMWISAKFHLMVIRAFDELQDAKAVADGLTPAQQRHIQKRVGELARIPGSSFKSVYGSIKDKFMVGTYKDVSADKYPELCRFLQCEPMEGEWLGKQDEGEFSLTKSQAETLYGLLHSVAWVSCRWNQGIGDGVSALNRPLYSATFEHVNNMARCGRILDEQLSHVREHFSYLGGRRPDEALLTH